MRTPKVVRTMYTGLAPFYDTLVPLVSSHARAAGLTWLQVQDGERILEVGTGTGLAFRQLVSENPMGWTEGLDDTPAMLRRARQRMENAPHSRYGLRTGDATALPYPDDTFHAVFSSYLLDILPKQQIQSALQEMLRVLTPNGRIVLVYLTAPQGGLECLWVGLSTAIPLLVGGARPLSLQNFLRDNGFDLEAHTTRSQAGLRSAITRATPS